MNASLACSTLRSCNVRISLGISNGCVARPIGEGGFQQSRVRPEEGPYVAHLLPLTTGTRRKANVTYSAVAAWRVQGVDERGLRARAQQEPNAALCTLGFSDPGRL